MTFIVKCAPVLKEWNFCCCSCSLRVGAVVLAWIAIVVQVSEFVTCVICLRHSEIYSETSHENTKLLISILGTVVGTLILDVLLLYGIHNKKPVYMVPFLVTDLICIVVSIAVWFIVVTFNNSSNMGLRLSLLLVVVFMGFAAYFWVVLYSYYRELDEEKYPNSGIVNCTYEYQTSNNQVKILPEDGKALNYFPNKLAPDMA